MSTDLLPENERFIQDVVASGWFQSRGEALDLAVELLKRRKAILDHIEGTRQLDNGEGIHLHGEAELRAFFDEINAEGMRKYEASRNSE